VREISTQPSHTPRVQFQLSPFRRRYLRIVGSLGLVTLAWSLGARVVAARVTPPGWLRIPDGWTLLDQQFQDGDEDHAYRGEVLLSSPEPPSQALTAIQHALVFDPEPTPNIAAPNLDKEPDALINREEIYYPAVYSQSYCGVASEAALGRKNWPSGTTPILIEFQISKAGTGSIVWLKEWDFDGPVGPGPMLCP